MSSVERRDMYQAEQDQNDEKPSVSEHASSFTDSAGFEDQLMDDSRLKMEMLVILERRLNHDRAAIDPIRRILVGPLSMHLTFNSRDPEKALDGALKQIKLLLQKRKITGRSDDIVKRRQAVLRHVLRQHQSRVNHIFDRIRDIKADLTSSTHSNRQRLLHAKIVNETGMHCREFLGSFDRLPLVVRQVVCANELVHVMKHATMDELRKMNWESMVEQAEANLRNFDEWMNQPPAPRQHSSQSFGGVHK